jgi:hypothetical protein
MANLRIRSSASAAEDPIKGYLERLVKMIPSEVVGLYLAGRGAIQGAYPTTSPPTTAEAPYWIAWTIFCLGAVIAVRAWATRIPGKPPQWPAVVISTVSFGIWVYSMGDVFVRTDLNSIWNALAGTLVVLAWTFVVPLVYKGDQAP